MGPDGVYVYALRAEDGSVLWKNSTANQQYMLLPHNNYEGITGVSPQGYLAADDGVLLVRTGRAMPARFDAATGRLLPWKIAWGKNHRPGSSWTMAAKGLFFGARRGTVGLPESSQGENSRIKPEGIMAWDLHPGDAVFALDDVYRAVFSDDTLYLTKGGYSGDGKGHVTAVDFEKLPKRGRIPPPWGGAFDGAGVSAMKVGELAKWSTPTGRSYELIKSGKVLISGEFGTVRVLAADTGEELCNASVEGQARALAVDCGRLLVGTSTGRIYCFGQQKVSPTPLADVGQADEDPSRQTRLAKEIIDTCGIRTGYCLVLGLDDPELPLGMIQQSDLHVIVLEEDEEKIARTRRRYDQLAYYGPRIVIHRGDLKKLPYPQYFANLILVGKPSSCDARGVYRCLRPCGGVLAILAAGETEDARKWLATTGADGEEVVADANLVRVKRGPLAGAGSWSHPFANTGRTSASRDKLVRLPLRTLWFGGPGPARMVDLHRYAPIPVYANGRLFVAGQHCVIGIDAYNGREMWARKLPGVGRFPGQDRGASVVADNNCVYAPHGINCLQLDGGTGKTLQVYRPPAAIKIPAESAVAETPQQKRRPAFVFNEVEWNYLAVTDEAILGTVGAAGVRKSFANWPNAAPCGKHLFALSKNDGRTLWLYESEHAVTPKCVVADDRRVYLLDQENDRGKIGQTTVKALDTIPAGGMVLMPEGSSTCTCAYSFQTSVVLVADTRHEDWGVYTCESPKQGSRIKTLSLNFGAVGDKRDKAGELWLGFPRPFSPQALEVPFDTCAKAEYCCQSADEISIAGTDRPWLYSCRVEGLESATLDLNLTRPAVVLGAKDSPRIDGKLNDACWDGAEPVELVDDSRRVDPRIRAWLRHDAENTYIGFHREASRKNGKPVPWTIGTKGDNAPTWQDDSLKVRFLSGPDAFACFSLSASGVRFTGQGARWETIRRTKRAWQSAVHVTPEARSAEIAIPSKAGPGLKIFLESFNRTGVGPERTFYKFRSWRRYYVGGGEADLVFERPPALPSRTYTVRLHFAELDQVKPAERVFDVRIQNKTVIEGLDVVSETGGCAIALTKEIKGIRASDTISFGLVPLANSKLPAILSAIEIVQNSEEMLP